MIEVAVVIAVGAIVSVHMVLEAADDRRKSRLIEALAGSRDEARRELRECRTQAASLAMLLTQARRSVEDLRERVIMMASYPDESAVKSLRSLADTIKENVDG